MYDRTVIDLSGRDIDDIVTLINKLLDSCSLILLSRDEHSSVNTFFIHAENNKLKNVVKSINRFGIKDECGDFHKFLNEIVKVITRRNHLFQIYDRVVFLLFDKLLEKWTKDSIVSKEEIELFILQPYEFLTTDLQYSNLLIRDIALKSNLSHRLKSHDAKEFLLEGVFRRVFMLYENINAISKIFDTERIDNLASDENAILTLSINAFYANIFAITDCLAFTIVFEDDDCRITREDQKKFRKIGLFHKDFPQFYCKYDQLKERLKLEILKLWYDEICNLRHPIAHRIPLYFPVIYNCTEGLTYCDATESHNLGCNAIFSDDTISPLERVDRISKLQKIRENEFLGISLFSGCFLHSDKESKRYYHLSRLVFDLGILGFILKESFGYIEEMIKPNSKKPRNT